MISAREFTLTLRACMCTDGMQPHFGTKNKPMKQSVKKLTYCLQALFPKIRQGLLLALQMCLCASFYKTIHACTQRDV